MPTLFFSFLLLFLSNVLLSSERKLGYEVRLKEDANLSLLIPSLTADATRLIISKLDHKTQLRAGEVSTSFYNAFVVRITRDVRYNQFTVPNLNGQRIEIDGRLNGINETRFLIFEPVCMYRFCEFIKSQKTIKLFCPSHSRTVISSANRTPRAANSRTMYLISLDDYPFTTYDESNIPWKMSQPGWIQNLTPQDLRQLNVREISKDEYSLAQRFPANLFIDTLVTLEDNEDLTTFECSGGAFAITAPMVKLFKTNLSFLKKLWLQNIAIEEEAGDIFNDLVHKHAHLEDLELVSCRLGRKETVDSFLVLLESNSKLKALSLSEKSCVLIPDRASLLASVLRNNSILTKLDIAQADFYSSHMYDFAQAVCANTTLTNLDLSYNEINPETSDPLKTIIHNNATIKILKLDAALNQNTLSLLIDVFSKNTSLTYLSLGNHSVDHTVAEKIRYLIDTNASLTRLDLQKIYCAKDATDEIKTILTSNTTKIINLSFEEN